MSVLVSDCPRCGTSKITLDVLGESRLSEKLFPSHVPYKSVVYEIFCRCRECSESTIFVVAAPPPQRGMDWASPSTNQNVTGPYRVEKFVNISDLNSLDAPEHLPKEVHQAFVEASRSCAIGCWNAAGCMFRASIDLATRSILKGVSVPDEREVRQLGRRLKWMFSNNHLPSDLKELSVCIKEDGDDAAHSVSLTQAEAFDLQDFSYVLLKRIFTDPEKTKAAIKRRDKRRAKK